MLATVAAYSWNQIAPLEAEGTAGGTSCGPSGVSFGRTFSVNSSAYLPGSGDPSDGPCRQTASAKANMQGYGHLHRAWETAKVAGESTGIMGCKETVLSQIQFATVRLQRADMLFGLCYYLSTGTHADLQCGHQHRQQKQRAK